MVLKMDDILTIDGRVLAKGIDNIKYALHSRQQTEQRSRLREWIGWMEWKPH